MYKRANFYTPAVQRQFNNLTPAQRELTIAFVSPNGEELTNDALHVFFTLMQTRVIEFAQPGSPNEHLHVPHPADQAKYFCTTCHHAQLVAA